MRTPAPRFGAPDESTSGAVELMAGGRSFNPAQSARDADYRSLTPARPRDRPNAGR